MELQSIRLYTAQITELAKLSENHTSPAHLYQRVSDDDVVVQFEFPYEYVIDTRGTSRQVSVG